MPPLLTKKRAAYVARRKPQTLNGKTLNYNAAVQERYARALTALVKQMTTQTRRELEKFFKGESAEAFFTMDANVGSDARILTNRLTRKFDQLFASKAKPLAESMVSQSDKASSAALHGSLKELSGGLSLKTSVVTGPMNEVMTASVAENVGLIKSISQKYLTDVQGAVMRSITTGNGLQDLVPFLEKHEGMTIRRARNIAMDQTRKAYNSLNEGRMIKLGLDEYEWLHTGGSKEPRQHHIELSGRIFSLTDPDRMAIIDPSTGQRGKPGDLPNCGCRMRPLIKFDEGSQE